MRFRGQRASVLDAAQELGLHGVTSDGVMYTCHECGSRWQRRERFAWWPIRVRWSTPRHSRWWGVAHWGAQIGADGIEQRVFARFVRVGPVVFSFGWREEYR